MADTSTKYLVYASLLLGSIGTYNAVKEMTSPKDVAMPGTSSFGGISATELNDVTSRLDDLTIDSQAIAERLLGLETWRTGKVNAARSVTTNSSPAQIAESVMDRLVDVESLGDTNEVNISTLRNDVDLNTSDVSAFSVDFQEQISTNKSAISAADLKIDTTDDNIANILTPRLDDIEADITLLGGEDTNMKSRIKALEEAEPLATAARDLIGTDLAGVAERVTNNETAVTDLEDDVELVVKESIAANKANITALVDDAGFLAEKFLRSGDDILCNGLLRANHGAQISLNKQWLRLLASNNKAYMMYVNNGSANEGPSGNAPAKGHGFEKNAVRIRTEKHADAGFIVENHNEEMLLSVRGSDGLTACAGPLSVHGKASIFSEGTNAFFAHDNFNTNADFALAHNSSGKTILQSNGTDKKIECRVNGTNMMEIEATKVRVTKELMVDYGSGVPSTHFRGTGNYISTGAGKKTFFRFGGANPSVAIRDKEINIDGTDVLAKLNALETRVKNIEDNYLNMRKTVKFRNHKTNGYIGFDGKPNAPIYDSNNHYEIKYD